MNRIGFSQRLELRQSQALVMTPQLQQAIKMLQLSNLELNNFVDAEIQQNPLLEHREPGGDDRHGLEFTAARPRTLREHLLEQIGTDLSDQGNQLVALHLLDQLDENGYLGGTLASIATLLGCDLARVEAVLARLQQFDPPGVFARDLPECLALQLRDRNRLDPAMKCLLDNLPLLAARNIPDIDVLPNAGLNVYDVLRRDKLVLTKDAVDAIRARFEAKEAA